MNNQAPIFASNDIVPFRFTPNMQQFVGPFHMEGIMTAGMMSIGRSLTEPEVSQPHFSPGARADTDGMGW